MNSYPQDARTAGTVMIIQILVAGILKRSTDRDALLREVTGLAESLTTDATDAMAAGDLDKWDYFSQLQSGAEDAIKAITEMSEP